MPLDPPERFVLLPTGAGKERTLPLDPLVNGQFAGWFPDGESLLIMASEPGEPLRLYQRDLDWETPPRPVTPPDVFAAPGSVTPDGRFVLGVLNSKPGLFPIDGGEPRPVPDVGPDANFLGWNADGTAAFISRPKPAPRSIFRVEVADSSETLLHEIQLLDPAGVNELGHVLISADGRAYAYTLTRTLSTLFLVEGLR
jgi:hypothetical protein